MLLSDRQPSTEDVNPRTVDIDQLSTADILRRINDEDALVAEAVAHEIPVISSVVDRVVNAFLRGGRLMYVGSGTSGRLGVLDAAECPPTFGTSPDQVQALLAGAPASMFAALEDVEDDEFAGRRAVVARQVNASDVVVGIASSGRTPYVVGALRSARELGACTVALVANADGPVAEAADLVIAPHTGPEVIAGSTRMKAGTAQKLVLNMISTAAMVRTGRTFGNLMVDMQPRNRKLHARSQRMVALAARCDPTTAERALDAANGEVKTAIVMLLAGIPAPDARAQLARVNGILRHAVPSVAGSSALLPVPRDAENTL